MNAPTVLRVTQREMEAFRALLGRSEPPKLLELAREYARHRAEPNPADGPAPAPGARS